MNPAQAILILSLRVYRGVLSPLKSALLGPAARCRFTPSCSAYALQAIATHGAWRGSLLALRRLVRCHPWGGQGHDPVPDPRARVKPEGSRPRAGREAAGRVRSTAGGASSPGGSCFPLSGDDRRPAETKPLHFSAS